MSGESVTHCIYLSLNFIIIPKKNIQIEILYSRSIIQGDWINSSADTYCQNWQTVRAYLRQRPYYDSPIEEPLSKFCYLDYCPRCCYPTMSMVAAWWMCPRKTAWKKVIMLEDRDKKYIFKLRFKITSTRDSLIFVFPVISKQCTQINIQYGKRAIKS